MPQADSRLTLIVGHDGPVIHLGDPSGKPLAALSCYEGGASLLLRAAQGNAAVSIVAMEKEPGLILQYANGKFTLAISVSNDGVHLTTPDEGPMPPIMPPSLSKLIH